MSDFVELFICFMASAMLQGAIIYVFRKMSQRKIYYNLRDIFIMLVASAVQMILNIHGLQAIGTIITIIYFYFMFQHLFHCTKDESQNYSVIIWIICLIIDVLVMFVVSGYKSSSIYEEHVNISKSVGTIIMSMILIAISKLKFITKFLRQLYQKMSKLNIPIKYIFVLIIIFSYVAVTGSNNLFDHVMITGLLIIAVFLIVITIILIFLNYKILTLKITNEILEKNNEVNQKAIYQFRILKHNLESQLMGVKTVANKKAKRIILYKTRY